LKKTLVPIAVLALSVLTAPVAFAQEPSDCAAATIALQTAKTDHDKAVAADKRLADAVADDQAVERAEREVRQAFRRVDGFVIGVHDVPSGRAIMNEIEDLLKRPEANPGGQDRRTLERKREVLRDYLRANDRLEDARRKADRTDVRALRRIADRTDADALKKVLDAAQDDVNRLCGGATTTPSPTPEPEDDIDCDEVSGPEAQRILDADRSDPNNLDNDHDGIACDVDEVPVPGDPAPADPGVVVNNNVAVPSGGVATGGGPAWAFK